MSVRLRYAPSPTGHLHIGGARTALFNYLYARKHGGQFILRIEDTDQTRNIEGAADKFYEELRWLGIEWDEGEDIGGPYVPYRCMERLDIYKKYVDQLLAENKAYYCYCTEEELEREREELLAKGQMPRYMGRCRHLTEEQKQKYEQEGRKKTIRFRVPEGQTITIQDHIRGEVQFDSDGIGDFVIVKSDGIPTYNFQVAIDDHLMKISLVVRGEEHLSNTPRQVMVYQAFAWDVPEFAHLPLILNENGKKLSKRDESIIQFISQYRELGYLPEAIVNFLALLGWSPGGEQEIFSKDELIQAFSLDRVNKSGAIFDTQKLDWMNAHYIKEAELERIVEMSIPYLQQAHYIGETYDREWVTLLVSLYKEQMTSVSQLPKLSALFFVDDLEYEGEAADVLREEQVPAVLSAFASIVEKIGTWTPDAIKPALKQVQKETGYKGRALFMTIRVAATGQVHGPDLNSSLYLLGKEKVLRRIKKFL